jgi:hypothetical protein
MADITVTVDDDHLDRVHDVAAALQDGGMEVTQVLDRLGVISGSVAEDRRAEVTAVDGVASVEDTGTAGVPSPDSPVQ